MKSKPDEELVKMVHTAEDESLLEPEQIGTVLDSDELIFAELMDRLKTATGVDYSHYKSGSVLRRIDRRMGLNGLHSLKDYAMLLQENEEELLLLQKDLLIGVTRFFRDPEAFAELQSKVLPAIFKSKQEGEEVRIWVAGCSTGEEAYTIAILLHQWMEQRNETYNVKIFATDLDKEAIEYAGMGLYPESSISHLKPEWVRRYFVKEQQTYQIHKDIRKLVVFAVHNLLEDPPFINLDLVTCRNVLIYIQTEIQRRLISLFHFSLHPCGFLFLGPSETVGSLSRLFTMIDRGWKIYQYKKSVRPLLSRAAGFGGGEAKVYPSRWSRFAKRDDAKAGLDGDPVEKALLQHLLPPCIVIDEHNEIVHTTGEMKDFIRIPPGKPSHNLLKLLASGLSVTVGSAVHKARKGNHEVRYDDIRLESPSGPVYLNLRVQPIVTEEGIMHLALLFERSVKAHDQQAGERVDIGHDVNQRIADLEQELQYAEDYLQATIEELEMSNEELKATNEELIAANEELQSTNEELQSLNEELVAVNDEYQGKILELTELNYDMDNLLVNTKIGTVFLDRKMKIRLFTPSISEGINLLDVDIGRPLSHISHNFRYGSLVKDAKHVLRTGSIVEKEVQSRKGRWFIMRILPYLYGESRVDGVVITFVDITELKSANEGLQLLSQAIEQSPSVIVIANPKGTLEYVNPKFTDCTGYSYMEAVGKSLEWLHRLNPDKGREIWEYVSSGGKWRGELESIRKDGGKYWESVTVIPIRNSEGEIHHYLRVAENITERKNTEEMLRKSEMLSAVGQLAAGIAHEIRNPLTALKGFTKLLRSRDQENRYIDIMSDELERIESIISELLILAKPQAVKYREKDLLTTIQEVIMLLDTQAILNNVEIIAQYGLQSCVVNCVDNQLKQVFINLLKNAIEAMTEGGQLRVILEPYGLAAVRIRFIDQGHGIPKEHLPQLGQPFYTTKEKGTGLGLMMTYKIVENHHGTMTIESEVGSGTTVTVQLPLVSAEGGASS